MNENGTEIVWVPVTEIEKPRRRGYYEVLIDCWWVIDSEGNAAMFSRHGHRWPLANSDRTIVEQIGLPQAIRSTDLNVATAQIRLAHVPHHCEDY